jgi:ATP-dependent helicase HrpB
VPKITLPVEARIPEILQALESARKLVLSAEPGAGKSTLIPKALLDQVPGKILVLEPRRVAAKLLATYVAELVGTPLGEMVGYHVRFDRKANDRTRLCYLTEGLLRRYIQSDPFISGVDAVVIDEFHERSLSGDVGLMLLRKIQTEVRPDLRILVMSATLDAGKASDYLEQAPVITVPGRGFPVQITYAPKIQDLFDLDEVSSKVVQAIGQVLGQPNDDGGHILVFLPGQREIRAVEALALQKISSWPSTGQRPLRVLPLYSQLPDSEIRRALESRRDERKILLATNIAESSVTLDGLSTVVDSGLQRRSNISSSHLVPYLEVARISRASSDQRAGRAGRQSPGRAVRLWTESDHRFLEAYEMPEVLRADPSAEILSLLDVGFTSISNLPWIDAPRSDVISTISDRLHCLDLVKTEAGTQVDRLTSLGRAVLETSLEMRWALFLEHLLRDVGFVDERSLLRACLPELGPRDRDGDLESLIETKAQLLKASASHRALVSSLGNRYKTNERISDDRILRALSRSFLDRVARVRNNSDTDKALMWGNRGLRLPQRARDEIHREDFLIAFDLDDSQHSNEDSRLRVYRWLPRKVLETVFPDRIREKNWAEKESKSGALRFWRAKFLDEFPLQDPIPSSADPVLVKQHRCQEIFEAWPELEESESRLGQLLRRLKLWGRTPTKTQVTETLESLGTLPGSLSEVAESETLLHGLEGLFSYSELSELQHLYPKTLKLPRGRERALDYRADGRVFLCVRLADLFGLATHPTLAQGRIKIHIEMLSPAGRSWQITQDLPSFWKTSYYEIRKEMRARYPRQPWPEDPIHGLE